MYRAASQALTHGKGQLRREYSLTFARRRAHHLFDVGSGSMHRQSFIRSAGSTSRDPEGCKTAAAVEPRPREPTDACTDNAT